MVATRSQVNVVQERNEMRDEQDNPNLGNRHQLRNPHHGLKEKMKALTQLYEQQKQSSISLRNPSPKPDKVRFSTHPSVDLLSSGSCKQESEKRKLSVVENQVMRENSMPVSTVSKTYILPQQPPPQPITVVAEDAKENIAVAVGGGGGGGGNAEKIVVMRENSMPASMVSRTYILPQQPPPQPPAAAEDARDKVAAVVGGGGGGNGEKIVGFTCPPRRGVVTTNVVRKLSMGGGGGYAAAGGGGEGVVKNAAESEGVTVKLGSVGSRILVFVRLRPLSKKEKEVGSRSCVRIVNQKEVYLTEFANENDYLRLKRLRGRHFTFDAAFPDSSSQLDVYSTS